jgi:amidase
VSTTALTGVPATELARMVRERAVPAVEVVAAHLRRIEAVDRTLNAVVELDAERALAAARDADEGRGPGGPLRGVPFTVKDNIEAAGIPMAIGDPERAGVVPDADATAVRRLRAAGAILLGKTNCPPYGGGIETDNPVHGRTSNPYDPARTPGGSSGGEAAIVAAAGSAFGVGTDSGASVRLPAHFCGLAAIKPTSGRVPVTGVIDDEGQIGALGDPRTQVGPLARSVADVALVLRLLCGPDDRDGGIAPVPLGDPAPVALDGLRVAVHDAYDHARAEPPAAAVLGDAADALREAGALVGEDAPPAGGHDLTIEVWHSYGGGLDSLGLYRLLRRWDAFRSRMLAWGERYDLVLSPVFPGPAPPHGALAGHRGVDPTSFTTPHSLTGWPAVTVRCGSSPEGLPIGVQVVARPWRDDVALAAALALEHALGGWRAAPL